MFPVGGLFGFDLWIRLTDSFSLIDQHEIFCADAMVRFVVITELGEPKHTGIDREQNP